MIEMRGATPKSPVPASLVLLASSAMAVRRSPSQRNANRPPSRVPYLGYYPSSVQPRGSAPPAYPTAIPLQYSDDTKGFLRASSRPFPTVASSDGRKTVVRQSNSGRGRFGCRSWSHQGKLAVKSAVMTLPCRIRGPEAEHCMYGVLYIHSLP